MLYFVSEATGLDILKQLLNAFKSLQNLETNATYIIIHRDVKPENILVHIPDYCEREEIYKLADFGLSRTIHSI